MITIAASTVLSLIRSLAFYLFVPYEGKISIDGADLQEVASFQRFQNKNLYQNY
jgi:hypothetical protein